MRVHVRKKVLKKKRLLLVFIEIRTRKLIDVGENAWNERGVMLL